jgi:phospholipid/cholesterol/gamma-HCH transport system permease protein
MGSSFICLHVYQIDSHHYWQHTQQYVKVWDVMTGLGKAVVFAFVLSLIACHRGFHGQPGAAGVGRAATEAFVWSFVAIIVLDFFLAMFANSLYEIIWPAATPKVA